MVRKNKQNDSDDDDDDDEDDYMTMSFADAPPPTESSLQRKRRERLAARERGRVKSKAQLETEAAEARERILSRSLLDDPAVARRSKGFAMMAKMGFRKGEALGKRREPGGGDGHGGGPQANEKAANATAGSSKGGDVTTVPEDEPRTEPIAPQVKSDRGGIGLDAERKRRLGEAVAEEERNGAKRPKPESDPMAYRDRVAKEREAARAARQVGAAQRLAERLEDEESSAAVDGGRSDNDDDAADPKSGASRPKSSKPLKCVNVLWRGMVRARETGERDRRLRRELGEALAASSRQPHHVFVDDEEDGYDRMAVGGGRGAAGVAIGDEELDEDDEELEAFEALEPTEKLERLVTWLRRERRYCFWCKSGYEDEAMEACPGTREEDHD